LNAFFHGPVSSQERKKRAEKRLISMDPDHPYLQALLRFQVDRRKGFV
jgi:hypothetical protein